MQNIKDIQAQEILDSRGNPTIQVTVTTSHGSGTASVPSGASTGIYEAKELRDGGRRYGGLGVSKAIKNIHQKIFPKLKGKDASKQNIIDQIMIDVDGYKDKRKLGANAILAVSLACARATADGNNIELYQYLNDVAGSPKMKLHTPFFNVINGGRHADNSLSIQEFMIVPQFNSFKKNLQAGSEIYHTLKKDLHKKYGSGVTNVGDEGGFAPQNFKHSVEAFSMLRQAITNAKYKGKIKVAIDAAASEFYNNGKYSIDGKKLSPSKLLEYYQELIKKYPLISIEDPFDQHDFKTFSTLQGIQVVGDDLTVTNVDRIKKAINAKSCNCLLLKLNQIGTLTEALEAANLAKSAGWNIMVSHRSGETTDTFIADLAVALGCGQIKAGAPCRSERTAKYNRLLEIEQLLLKYTKP